MVERHPILDLLTHLVLIIGVAVVVFPVWIAFVASTHGPGDFLTGVTPVLPGPYLIENYSQLLGSGMEKAGTPPLGLMLANSLLMAVSIAVGKIIISILSAYAIVYFKFPLRGLAFWVIFITLMLPVEVRIMPTFGVVASLGLLNSYTGLILPLIASATATFLLRQFFLTVPDELLEAARVDGATELQVFRRIVFPLLLPTIAVITTTLIIFALKTFDIVYVLGQNGNFGTEVIANRMYKELFSDLQPGRASATSVILLLAVIPIMIYNIRRFREQEAIR
jgi:sn-glycerol 3-phosphate transport system permease protein